MKIRRRTPTMTSTPAMYSEAAARPPVTAGQRPASCPDDRLTSSSRPGLTVNNSAAATIRVTAATPIHSAA
jgi:hypothetical protein